MAKKKDKQEYSKSGQPIYRHSRPENDDIDFAVGNEDSIEAITEHIGKHITIPSLVFHELISDKVHIDVHIVPPTERFPFQTLVTSGMSDKPMTLPPNVTAPQYAELLVCLPSDWSMKQEDFMNENIYWPIRWLKTLARLPHEYRTWFGFGHTIPNGDPPRPFAENTQFVCWLLKNPTMFPPEFARLTLPDQREIQFYQIIPLYQSEMQIKLNNSTEVLLERMEKAGVNDVVQISRKNVCPPEPKNKNSWKKS